MAQLCTRQISVVWACLQVTGLYDVSFTSTTAGTLRTDISIKTPSGGQVQAFGSPYETPVPAAAINAQVSTISGPGLQGALVGTPTFVFVTLRDTNGVQIEDATRANSIVFRVDPPSTVSPTGGATSIVPVEGQPGKYKVTYMTVNTGAFTPTIAIIPTEGAEPVPVGATADSPLRFVSDPASTGATTVDPAQSVLTGDGLYGGISGSESSFSLTLRDGNGLVVDGSNQEVSFDLVDANGGSMFDPSLFSMDYREASNDWAGSYTATVTGIFSLIVTVNGVEVQRSEVNVRPGKIDPRACESLFGNLNTDQTITAGGSITVNMYPKDTNGNRLVTLPNERIFLDYSTPENNFEASMVLKYLGTGSNRQFYFSWDSDPAALYRAGKYFFTVMVEDASGLSIQAGIQLELTVEPGRVVPGDSVVSGPGLYSGGSGVGNEVRLTLYDAYGNIITSRPPANFVASLQLQPVGTSDVTVEPVTMVWSTGVGFVAEYVLASVGEFNIQVAVTDTLNPEAAPLVAPNPPEYTSTSVRSTTTNTSMSTASGGGLSVESRRAGGVSIFTIQARDANGNPTSVGGSRFQVSSCHEFMSCMRRFSTCLCVSTKSISDNFCVCFPLLVQVTLPPYDYSGPLLGARYLSP